MPYFEHPLLTALSAWDYAALAILVIGWVGTTWLVEASPIAYRAMNRIMEERRFNWLRQMMARENQVLDGILLTSLQSSSTFFASTSLIGAGGVLALLDSTERLVAIAADFDLPAAGDAATSYEVKLFLLLWMLVQAFLKFAWAARLFNYCAVVMGGVPHVEGQLDAMHSQARQAARMSSIAAKAFNRGLRTLYFFLAGLAWLAGPLFSICATLLVVRLIYRREFASESRLALLDGQEPKPFDPSKQ